MTYVCKDALNVHEYVFIVVENCKVKVEANGSNWKSEQVRCKPIADFNFIVPMY